MPPERKGKQDPRAAAGVLPWGAACAMLRANLWRWSRVRILDTSSIRDFSRRRERVTVVRRTSRSCAARAAWPNPDPLGLRGATSNLKITERTRWLSDHRSTLSVPSSRSVADTPNHGRYFSTTFLGLLPGSFAVAITYVMRSGLEVEPVELWTAYIDALRQTAIELGSAALADLPWVLQIVTPSLAILFLGEWGLARWDDNSTQDRKLKVRVSRTVAFISVGAGGFVLSLCTSATAFVIVQPQNPGRLFSPLVLGLATTAMAAAIASYDVSSTRAVVRAVEARRVAAADRVADYRGFRPLPTRQARLALLVWPLGAALVITTGLIASGSDGSAPGFSLVLYGSASTFLVALLSAWLRADPPTDRIDRTLKSMIVILFGILLAAGAIWAIAVGIVAMSKGLGAGVLIASVLIPLAWWPWSIPRTRIGPRARWTPSCALESIFRRRAIRSLAMARLTGAAVATEVRYGNRPGPEG